jgi:tetratricopeptide (TPR) repeat protein
MTTKENKMKLKGVLVGLLCVILPAASWAGDGDGQAQFTQGTELLSKGDLDGAAKAFEAAAKAEPDNQNYQVRAAIVQRVLAMRQTLDEQTDNEKWLNTAKALHTFYDENGIHDQALALANRAHTKLNTTETAVMLARSRLALGMNSEAAEGLRGITQSKIDAQVRVLLGLALARQGQKDEAAKLLGTLKDDAPESPQCEFDLARLHTLLGQHKEATAALVRCFETTPPSGLDAIKEQARTCDDLKPLQSKPEFKKALDTQSKVAESKCSKGPDCGKCPLKKKCQGKDQKSHEDCKGHGKSNAPSKP